jgi:hypothetical protein
MLRMQREGFVGSKVDRRGILGNRSACGPSVGCQFGGECQSPGGVELGEPLMDRPILVSSWRVNEKGGFSFVCSTRVCKQSTSRSCLKRGTKPGLKRGGVIHLLSCSSEAGEGPKGEGRTFLHCPTFPVCMERFGPHRREEHARTWLTWRTGERARGNQGGTNTVCTPIARTDGSRFNV